MEKRHPTRVTPKMLLELKRLREEAAESRRIIEDLKGRLEAAQKKADKWDYEQYWADPSRQGHGTG